MVGIRFKKKNANDYMYEASTKDGKIVKIRKIDWNVFSGGRIVKR